MVRRNKNTSKRKMQVRNNDAAGKTTKIGRGSTKNPDSTARKSKSDNQKTVSSPYTKDDIKSLNTGTPKTKTAQMSGTEKRKAKRKKRRMTKIIVALVVVVLAGLGVGFGFLYNSDYFTIENIEINGVSHLTDEEMLLLANVPEGETLIRVDTGKIEDRLKMDAWIQDVEVVRQFPSTLLINVHERAITAIVEVPTSSNSGVSTSNASNGTSVRNWAISADYIWLMPIPDQKSEAAKNINQQIYADVAGIMHIVDASPSINPEIGSRCTDETVTCAIGVVASMTTELRNMVKSVKAVDTNSTTLVLNNGVEIAIGTSEDIRDKERICLELLDRYSGKITHINVRNPQSPTWRTL